MEKKAVSKGNFEVDKRNWKNVLTPAVNYFILKEKKTDNDPRNTKVHCTNDENRI